MNALITQQLLERLSALLRNEMRGLAGDAGLQPVQCDALYYLSHCNRYSDTAKAVTDFLGLTKGTVSQSLKVLEKKGLIEKQPDTEDRRIVHLHLTPEGNKLVDQLMPSPMLGSAISGFSDQQTQSVEESLSELLKVLQAQNGMRSFGQCRSCRHNQKLESGGYFCNLTKEALSVDEIELICREHEELG